MNEAISEDELDEIRAKGSELLNRSHRLRHRESGHDHSSSLCFAKKRTLFIGGLLLCGAVGAFGYNRYRASPACRSDIDIDAGAAYPQRALAPPQAEAQAQASYYYPDNQPEVCYTQSLRDRCEEVHVETKKRGRIFNRMSLKVGKTRCFCPPPLTRATYPERQQNFAWPGNMGSGPVVRPVPVWHGTVQ